MSNSTGHAPSPRKLKLAYLFQQFPLPTETFAVSDIAALIDQGHRVTAYTMKFSPRNQKALSESMAVPAELHIFRPTLAGAMSWPRIVWRWRREIGWLFRRIIGRCHSSPATCFQALLCIPRLAEIAEAIAGQEFDVVHAFWSRHVGLALPLLKRRGAPMTLRTTFVGAYDLVADDFITDLVTQSAEVLFSHAEVNRPYLQRKAPEGASIAIIHRGIPLARPASAEVRNPYRLVTASALVPSKNVEMVIRSFAEARQRVSQLTLDIYGEGPDRARLEKIARELDCATAIRFNGHIPRQKLFEEMQQASAFLLLSKKPSERLPNVLKEALWAGCAVITSTSEGIEELIPDPGIGHVVDPDDRRAVGAALASVMSESATIAEARRRRAQAFIAANFSSDASMARYVDAWRNKAIGDHVGELEAQYHERPRRSFSGLSPSGAE